MEKEKENGLPQTEELEKEIVEENIIEEVSQGEKTKPYAIIGTNVFYTKEEYSDHINKNYKKIKKTAQEIENENLSLKEKVLKLEQEQKLSSTKALSDFDEKYHDFIKSKLDLSKEDKDIKEDVENLKKEFPKFVKEIDGNWTNKNLTTEKKENKNNYIVLDDGTVAV